MYNFGATTNQNNRIIYSPLINHLDSPKMLSTEQVASKSLLLKWQPVEGANFYKIEVS